MLQIQFSELQLSSSSIIIYNAILSGTGIIYALLTKREVKMAGYWSSSFFAFLWTETRSRSIKTQKKERGQYPAILTEQAWSIKDLLYGFIFKLKLQQQNKQNVMKLFSLRTQTYFRLSRFSPPKNNIFRRRESRQPEIRLRSQARNCSARKEILLSRPIYFQCIFGLACNHGKQGILNYLKVLIL